MLKIEMTTTSSVRRQCGRSKCRNFRSLNMMGTQKGKTWDSWSNGEKLFKDHYENRSLLLQHQPIKHTVYVSFGRRPVPNERARIPDPTALRVIANGFRWNPSDFLSTTLVDQPCNIDDSKLQLPCTCDATCRYGCSTNHFSVFGQIYASPTPSNRDIVAAQRWSTDVVPQKDRICTSNRRSTP